MSIERITGTFTPGNLTNLDQVKASYFFNDLKARTETLASKMQGLDEKPGTDLQPGAPGQVTLDQVDLGGRAFSGTCTFDPRTGHTETLSLANETKVETPNVYKQVVNYSTDYADRPEETVYISHRREESTMPIGVSLVEETIDDVKFVVDKKTGVVSYDLVHEFNQRAE